MGKNETQQFYTAPVCQSAIPSEVREDLAETIEDIGQAMGLLREAVYDTEAENPDGGRMCASDALEILSGLESKFSGMAARLAAWSENAKVHAPSPSPETETRQGSFCGSHATPCSPSSILGEGGKA